MHVTNIAVVDILHCERTTGRQAVPDPTHLKLKLTVPQSVHIGNHNTQTAVRRIYITCTQHAGRQHNSMSHAVRKRCIQRGVGLCLGPQHRVIIYRANIQADGSFLTGGRYAGTAALIVHDNLERIAMLALRTIMLIAQLFPRRISKGKAGADMCLGDDITWRPGCFHTVQKHRFTHEDQGAAFVGFGKPG